MSAGEKFRYDLEAEIFGEHVVRIPDTELGGETVERGSGSAFQMLPDEVRTRITVADDLIAAERLEETARTDLTNVTIKYSQATSALTVARRRAGFTGPTAA